MTNNTKKKAAMMLSIAVALAAFSGQAWAEQGTKASAPASITTTATKSVTKSATKAGGINPYEVAGIKDPAAFTAYFAKLQKAVKDNKPEQVAELISYPMNLNKNNKTFLIYSKKDFVNKYDRIFTSAVRANLLAQQVDQLFVNYQGVRVGEGDLWIGERSHKLGVISVNVINNPYEAAGIQNPVVFEHNFSLLQKYVKEGKKSEAAQLMVYPLKVNSNGKTMEIKTAKDFIAKYDKIMTAKVKKALLAQKVDKVGVNWKGISIGNGALWMGQSGEQVGVFAINL
ncbi:hypothetical protein AWM70_08865 [Paenibacillus yonginensis]|uniref:Uncharacterized protein n=1 Tax=Paenibacillus yonginensis TaxID=1462996 RepID=A0A1B1MZU0_9BACL|nr:hypothetical protein [Paenibacillus yonginensis]ANS74685.1 hypothetical protein AWM70_08865 [Paenibacillus yonginensis]